MSRIRKCRDCGDAFKASCVSACLLENRLRHALKKNSKILPKFRVVSAQPNRLSFEGKASKFQEFSLKSLKLNKFLNKSFLLIKNVVF